MRTIGWIWLLLKKHYLFSKVSSNDMMELIEKYREKVFSDENFRKRNEYIINYKSKVVPLNTSIEEQNIS